MISKSTLYLLSLTLNFFFLPYWSSAQMCGGTFMDTGGKGGGYANNENYSTTICPDTPGEVVYITFTLVDIETANGGGSNGTGCWDYLAIYNGMSTAAPFLGYYCGEVSGDGGTPNSPGILLQAGDEFFSTDDSGCLTFVFFSDGSVVEPGWEANIVCAPPPLCPELSNLTVSNITPNTADIAWSSISGIEFDLEYGEEGFLPGTGTTINTVNTTESITGLTGSTTYDVYVRNDCAGGMTEDMLITGVFDGPLPGGLPKGIELYVVNPVPDLSEFGLGCANNGGGTDGEEFTFPAIPANAGDFLYLTTDSASFHTYFGFSAPFVQSDFPSAASINGDDAIELFMNGTVIDVFGEIDVDGSGQIWEYTDGWAYRNSGATNNVGVFDPSNWFFSGIDAVDGDTLNVSSDNPWPLGSFEAPLSAWIQTSFMTLCDPFNLLGDSLLGPIIVPSLPYMDVNSNASCYTNQYEGRVTPDVIYQFTTGPCADSIRISTCNDISDFDTYLYLLDASGAQLALNDDAPLNPNPCPFTLNGNNYFSTLIYDIDVNTTYFAVVDGYNAAATGTFGLEIEEITIPEPVIMVGNISCNGSEDGQIDLTPAGVGPFTFLWSNGATTEDLSGLPVGGYTGTVTDVNGCIFVTPSQLVITEPLPLLPDFSTLEITDVSCNGESDGGIQIDMTGGTMPYNFLWSNGATTEDLSGLSPGIYTGAVADANGCLFVTPVPLAISEPDILTLDAIVTDESAPGNQDGAINLKPSGGTTPYSFLWSNGVTTEELTGLAPGEYSTTVTDANGCMAESTWIVMEGSVGVNDIQELDLFEVYPSPTQSEALLRLKFTQAVDIRVKLVNLLGQVLFMENAQGVMEYQKKINTDRFAPGVYYVSLLVDGENAVKPLVVAR